MTVVLTMVISLFSGLSISASAGDPQLYFYIGSRLSALVDGDTYTSTDLPGIITSGSAKLEGNKLILNNVVINAGSDYGINIEDVGTAIIELIGNNIITSNTDGIHSTGDETAEFPSPLLEILSATGSQGSLEVNGDIYSDYNNLTINNCTISTTNTKSHGTGLYVNGGDLSISGSKLSSTGDEVGLGADCEEDIGGKISIINSTVTSTGKGGITGDTDCSIINSKVTSTATAPQGFGMAIEEGVTITNSIVQTKGGYGVVSESGGITVNSGKLTAKATYENGAAIAVLGEFNLGTGMYIKEGGKIVAVSYNGTTIKTIAPADSVSMVNGDFTGAAKDVVICGPGTVNVASQKPSNISSVILPSTTDLQNAVLTQAEKDAVASGTNVNIQLVINNVQVPSDASKVTQNLGKNTLGMYLDILVLKTIGETQTSVHNLNAPIRITFTIPDNLKGKSNYYIIRVHNEVPTILNDLDSDPNTVTFETDRFSTYALVYSSSVNTSDNSNAVSLMVMAIASLGAIALIEKKKVK